jgi:hypothetical protein
MSKWEKAEKINEVTKQPAGIHQKAPTETICEQKVNLLQ